jgi:hypothetical protein
MRLSEKAGAQALAAGVEEAVGERHENDTDGG